MTLAGSKLKSTIEKWSESAESFLSTRDDEDLHKKDKVRHHILESAYQFILFAKSENDGTDLALLKRRLDYDSIRLEAVLPYRFEWSIEEQRWELHYSNFFIAKRLEQQLLYLDKSIFGDESVFGGDVDSDEEEGRGVLDGASEISAASAEQDIFDESSPDPLWYLSGSPLPSSSDAVSGVASSPGKDGGPFAPDRCSSAPEVYRPFVYSQKQMELFISKQLSVYKVFSLLCSLCDTLQTAVKQLTSLLESCVTNEFFTEEEQEGWSSTLEDFSAASLSYTCMQALWSDNEFFEIIMQSYHNKLEMLHQEISGGYDPSSFSGAMGLLKSKQAGAQAQIEIMQEALRDFDGKRKRELPILPITTGLQHFSPTLFHGNQRNQAPSPSSSARAIPLSPTSNRRR